MGREGDIDRWGEAGSWVPLWPGSRCALASNPLEVQHLPHSPQGALMRTIMLAALIIGVPLGRAGGQEPGPLASDVESPRALVLAAYAAIAREPGKPYDWERFRTLFLEGALLIPNTEQTGGVFTPLSVEGFISWLDEVTDPSSPNDRGFIEGEVHAVTERYGDIAQVFSTYEKHYWGDETVVGLGINSFQMVRHEDRWWITAIIWDEPDGGEPIPEEYLP